MAGKFDLLIVGGGISGSALLHVAARYTNLKRIGLIEKYDELATVNSSGRNNSQTIHCGDIETNYSLEKALYVKQAADMVVNYAQQQDNTDELVYRHSKMVLGVGQKECEALRQRFKVFSPHYPHMRLMEREDIAEVEPKVVEKRREDVVALGTVGQYSTANFAALSESFVRSAQKVRGKDIELIMKTLVEEIVEIDGVFHVQTDQGSFTADSVVVSAGGHSLLLAQQMGYGEDYSVFPVAGSFYFTPQVLNGKVYTVQNDKLPFAAVHGDPDVLVDNATRFGPTAVLLPMLERYNAKSIREFFKVLKLDKDVLAVFWKLLKVSDIRNYIIKNVLFEVPVLRRYLFLKDVRKIIPSLTFKEVKYAKGFGGLRPQLVDKPNQELRLGEAKINPGTGIIFNMTPSPGATSCLQNALMDAQLVCKHLKAEYFEHQVNSELLKTPSAAEVSAGKEEVYAPNTAQEKTLPTGNLDPEAA